MARTRLGPSALGLILTLAVVAVSHELTDVTAHGAGDGYQRAMAEGGHEPYSGGFML